MQPGLLRNLWLRPTEDTEGELGMKEEIEGTTGRSADYADEEIAEDLEPEACWVSVPLKLSLSKSEREKRTC
jgi:hypothetical protein